MKFVAMVFLLFVCVATTFVSRTYAGTVPAITAIASKNTPVTNNGLLTVTYLDLEAVNDIESKLSMNLPANKQEAEAMVRQRIHEYGQDKLEQDIREAYTALAFVMRLGIDRYPAIVFDNQFVVYGVTNIADALNRYTEWQKNPEINP